MQETFPRTIRGQFDRAYAILGTTRKGVVRARVARAIGLGVDAMQKWDQGQSKPDGVIPALVAAVDKIEDEERFAAVREHKSVDKWRELAIYALNNLPDETVVEFCKELDREVMLHRATTDYRHEVLAELNGDVAGRIGTSGNSSRAASKKSKPHSRKKPPSDQDAD